jgi:hypothetical protein
LLPDPRVHDRPIPASWNLRFDFIPTRMGETTIQQHPFDAKPENDAAEPDPAPRSRASDGPRAPRK